MAAISFRRSLDGHRSYDSSFYAHRPFVQDLDIVDELSGHTGCVNALAWSKSGRLLASGSDDTHLNIHKYQPEAGRDTDKNFSFETSIFTGHGDNIFSVKFMPHSDDRILASCAGDHQVRVFDIEYDGLPITSVSQRRHPLRGRQNRAIFPDVKYLTDATTGGKVYKSHSNRVKRLVTEASPYLLLSCSEDGEVRQWDIREPSSSYPSSRGENTRAPPPLITYKRFHLDLNTISCSGSQPHYIALGGAHQHAFLHDRRMIGRDLAEERGKTSATGKEDAMDQATRCVRRFSAPPEDGKSQNRRCHITALKISDWNPNEVVVSWSGNHIYQFDMTDTNTSNSSTSSQNKPSARRRSARPVSEPPDPVDEKESDKPLGGNPRPSPQAENFEPISAGTDTSTSLAGTGGAEASSSIATQQSELLPGFGAPVQELEMTDAQVIDAVDAHISALGEAESTFAIDEAIEEEVDGEEDPDSDDDDSDASGSDSDTESDLSLTSFLPSRPPRSALQPLASHTPLSLPIQSYRGHCNRKTIKDVNLYGPRDEYVVSGSDDGNLFIWARKTGELLNVLWGDGEVVNVLQPHPVEPMLAVSGIDDTVKIFGIDQVMIERARRGLGVDRNVREGAGRERRAYGAGTRLAPGQRIPTATTDDADEAALLQSMDPYMVELDLLPASANGGLASRKRATKAYEITQRNEEDRTGNAANEEQMMISRAILRRIHASYLASMEGNEGGVAGAETDGQGNIRVNARDCAVQ